MKKLNLKYFIIACLIGVSIGKYIFHQYKDEALNVISQSNDEVFLMQYGVYDTEENMKNSTSDLKNYFYYKEDNQYHVLIGITKNKNLKQKIIDSYEISNNIYMKKIKINNLEFLQSLDQYDNLINQTDNKEVIITSEKQILSRYEELILNE